MHSAPTPTLNQLREQIDQLDQQLISVLAERFKLTRQVGQIKNQQQLASVTNDRYAEVLHKWKTHAKTANLNPQLASKLFEVIHDFVVAEHDAIKNGQQQPPC